MDSIQHIAISKIVDLLSDGNLIIPKLDNWKRIFYNSGQRELYDERKSRLVEQSKNENYEIVYYNNDRLFSALLEAVSILIEDTSQFLQWCNSCLEKITIYRVFDEIVDSQISPFSRGGFDICDHIRKKGMQKANELLSNYPSKSFKLLRSNLNMLAFDVEFDEELVLKISPFFMECESEVIIKSAMILWLERHYTNVLESYTGAVKMCSAGNSVECLTNCRNVITGIMSYSKGDKNKWIDGLYKSCMEDRNIHNVSNPANIPSWKTGSSHADEVNLRYNYPRFKTIFQIYSYLSDLGPHINEGPKIEGIVDHENASVEDAMFGLRMTESILIWLYKNRQENL